jgi:hypothetical protein
MIRMRSPSAIGELLPFRPDGQRADRRVRLIQINITLIEERALHLGRTAQPFGLCGPGAVPTLLKELGPQPI